MDDRWELLRLGARIHRDAWAAIEHQRPESLPPADGDWPRPPRWWGPWPPPNAGRSIDVFGPLPDPWSWDRQAQMAIILLTRRIADGAAIVHAQGGDAVGFVRSVLDDDWCIVGRPAELKLPKAWWHDVVPPPDEPRPIAPDLHAVFAAAGASFMSLAAQVGNAPVRQALEEAGQRSLDVATQAA